MSENNNTTTTASTASFGLTPSQAMKPNKGIPPDKKGGDSNNNNGNDGNKGRNKNNNRRRRNGNNKNKNNPKPPPPEGGDANGAIEGETGKGNTNTGRKQRPRQRGKKAGNASNTQDANANANSNSADQPPAKRNPKKRKPKKKYPWRRHIPRGTVDPITLDNLNTLEYPPFALCADEPYVPVPVWPVPKENAANNTAAPAAPATARNKEDLNRQRLADQWGEHLLPNSSNGNGNGNASKPKPVPPLSERPLNLFDGRALAFYMVSQLQFIDPFTRRDLTRAELQNLDRYLEQHKHAGTNHHRNKKNNKKQTLKVTEAYDAKGITLSSAGAAAATAQGRADIMQQMAQQLLNSLFVGQPSVSSIPTTTTTTSNHEPASRREQAESFSLQEQYAAMQRQERAVAQAAEQRGFLDSQNNNNNNGDEDFGGFMIIDDDENPELRGRGHNDFPSLEAAPTTQEGPAAVASRSTPFVSTWSSGNTTARGASNNQAGAFPALPKPKAEAATGTKYKSKKSQTLAKMFKVVKKTTAEEKQSQWEAREAARRKAMMSNMTYGMNPAAAMDPSRSLMTAPASAASGSATEEQLQRNKAFAEALGVKPATQRHYASGWARPTNDHELELEAVLYPDELILLARDHSSEFLMKLEKRWKRFLNDDKAASLPLNRMDKRSRKLVHHYAEFWHLKTESFDPEPNRYIHCVKLQDTCMPQPLLSDAARHWRGPTLPDATRTIASVMNDHTSQQTAGQTSKSSSSSFETVAAPAKLRSALAMSSSKGDLVALGEAAVQNSRSDVLMDKQRPQLKLLPRTVPRELPPFEEQHEAPLEEDLRRRQVRLEEKRRKEREIEQKKKQVLEDAFASDDESDGKRAAFSDSESWGDDQEALYVGSDEE